MHTALLLSMRHTMQELQAVVLEAGRSSIPVSILLMTPSADLLDQLRKQSNDCADVLVRISTDLGISVRRNADWVNGVEDIDVDIDISAYG